MNPGELAPCPFCGGTDVSLNSHLEGNEEGYNHEFVVCRNLKCLAEGPISGIMIDINPELAQEEAIYAWNFRSELKNG